MHLVALDTVQITSVQAGPLLAGQPFEINDGDGQLLIDRGIARLAKDGDPAPVAKPQVTTGNVSVVASPPASAAKPKVKD